MLGLGLGLNSNGRPRVDQRIGPYVDPTNLYMAHGVKRLVFGYNGNLFRLVRASDSATLDVACAILRDKPDYAAIATWVAGTTAAYDKIYDQSGNGRDLVQTTPASRPPYDGSILVNGLVPACFTGEIGTIGVASPFQYEMGVTGISIDRRNSTTFFVMQPRSSLQKNVFLEYRTSGVGSMGYYTDSAISAGYYSWDGTTARGAALPRAMPSVFGSVAGGANSITHLRETTFSSSIMASGTVDSFYVGGSAIASFYGRNYYFGSVTYNAALTATPALALRTALISSFSVPTSFTKRYVFNGDSAFEGYASTRMRALPQQLVLTGAEIFNTAIGGDSMNACYTNRVARRDNLYTASVPCYSLCDAGINDMLSGGSGATVYANYTTPWITSGQLVGFKMGQALLLPITYSGMTAGDQANRVSYNSAVSGNAAGADFIVDVTANTLMGPLAAPDDSTLYADKIHPTTLGYGYLATGSWQPVLDAH